MRESGKQSVTLFDRAALFFGGFVLGGLSAFLFCAIGTFVLYGATVTLLGANGPEIVLLYIPIGVGAFSGVVAMRWPDLAADVIGRIWRGIVALIKALGGASHT